MAHPILPGCEPLSVAGSDLGVLVVHGFTGSPVSMRSFADGFVSRGYSVEMPLLPGHGTHIDDMVPTRWEDWYGAAEAAYLDLASRCRAVAVVGLSMGGGISLALAENHANVAALGLVNPMVLPLSQDLLDGIDLLLESGLEVFEAIGGDIAMEGVTEASYDGNPLRAGRSLSDAMETVSANLGAITCPVLVCTSVQDHVVPPASADLILSDVSGPVRQVLLERSYHVATLDYDRELLEAEIFAHVDAVLGGAA